MKQSLKLLLKNLTFNLILFILKFIRIYSRPVQRQSSHNMPKKKGNEHFVLLIPFGTVSLSRFRSPNSHQSNDGALRCELCSIEKIPHKPVDDFVLRVSFLVVIWNRIFLGTHKKKKKFEFDITFSSLHNTELAWVLISGKILNKTRPATLFLQKSSINDMENQYFRGGKKPV